MSFKLGRWRKPTKLTRYGRRVGWALGPIRVWKKEAF